jgi:hypothetical protein
MDKNDYQTMYEMESCYWWFIGRRKLVDWLITRYSTCGGEKLSRTSISPVVSYRDPPYWINKFFVWLLGLEGHFLKLINIPFGVSLLVVSRKPYEKQAG